MVQRRRWRQLGIKNEEWDLAKARWHKGTKAQRHRGGRRRWRLLGIKNFESFVHFVANHSSYFGRSIMLCRNRIAIVRTSR